MLSALNIFCRASCQAAQPVFMALKVKFQATKVAMSYIFVSCYAMHYIQCGQTGHDPQTLFCCTNNFLLLKADESRWDKLINPLLLLLCIYHSITVFLETCLPYILPCRLHPGSFMTNYVKTTTNPVQWKKTKSVVDFQVTMCSSNSDIKTCWKIKQCSLSLSVTQFGIFEVIIKLYFSCKYLFGSRWLF